MTPSQNAWSMMAGRCPKAQKLNQWVAFLSAYIWLHFEQHALHPLVCDPKVVLRGRCRPLRSLRACISR